MIVQIEPEILSYSKAIQGLCARPYYGHPRCPNFGKRKTCPPYTKLIDKVLDFSKDMYVVYTEFIVGQFAEKIRRMHPEWKSPRQWYNPRYWQPKARKFQRQEEQRAVDEFGLGKIIDGPEAHGVNVTDMMEKIGVRLEWQWPPKHNVKNKVYLVSLAGFPL